MNSTPRSTGFLAFPWTLTTPLVFLALAAVSASAGDAPSRVVPSGFVDTQPDKPCLVQIEEQGLSKDIAQLQAAVHACMKGRFNQFKAARPELYPTEGKPQTNRPK
jgi:hypothetical protein